MRWKDRKGRLILGRNARGDMAFTTICDDDVWHIDSDVISVILNQTGTVIDRCFVVMHWR